MEQILTQMKRKEQYEDVIFGTLEEEITTLIGAGMLHTKDNNSLLIENPVNMPTKEEATMKKLTVTTMNCKKFNSQLQHSA